MKFDCNKLTTAFLSDDDFKLVNSEMDETYFKSGLDVFNDHNGFRKGEVHTFVGTKGSGKSTWAKSILAELAWQEKSVLLYISEENTKKYVLALNNIFRLNRSTSSDVAKYLENIIVLSEMDASITNFDTFFNYVEEIIKHAKVEVFLFDNFTTAFLSELHINEQSRLLRRFKEIADRYNVCVILFFHTSKNVDPKNLDGDSVKGSGTAINIGSYNYVIYQHKDTSVIRNFIHTEKARYHSMANKKVYEVMYNYKTGIFTKCSKITMQDYKKIVTEKKSW